MYSVRGKGALEERTAAMVSNELVWCLTFDLTFNYLYSIKLWVRIEVSSLSDKERIAAVKLNLEVSNLQLFCTVISAHNES